ncbi:conserved hypothetical protein [Candidatus Nitrosotenuis uzonensis]|uniref:Transcription factor Pcc1 n=2 Tax=Candidatus Nitrosotenuis uzonensis TaxID=1407055 RepID=A0A812F1M9_9ARCH|nr:conserved hypothetical protein [Candidatus Nitrosotenuis uzonensis]
MPVPLTMSAFSARVEIRAKEKTRAIFDSIRTDDKFYPENPTRTKFEVKQNKMQITIESDEISHLRANLNSILRLIQASEDSIESVKI